MNNNTFKSLSDLSNGIKEKIDLIDSGKYGIKELENALFELNELQERLIVLKYKAIEQLASTVNKPLLREELNGIPSSSENSSTSAISNNSNQMTIMDGIKEVSKETIAEKFSEKEAINDKVHEGQTSLAEQMESSSISDIRSAIGINQKFSFRKVLFSDDNGAYDAAIDQIDKSNSHKEAQRILIELRKEHSWNSENEVAVEFEELINRRFSV